MNWVRSRDQILDLQIESLFWHQIFDLLIELVSRDRILFIWSFSFKMSKKKHLKIKFSLLDTFCLILNIKRVSPLGFGSFCVKCVFLCVLMVSRYLHVNWEGGTSDHASELFSCIENTIYYYVVILITVYAFIVQCQKHQHCKLQKQSSRGIL